MVEQRFLFDALYHALMLLMHRGRRHRSITEVDDEFFSGFLNVRKELAELKEHVSSYFERAAGPALVDPDIESRMPGVGRSGYRK